VIFNLKSNLIFEQILKNRERKDIQNMQKRRRKRMQI